MIQNDPICVYVCVCVRLWPLFCRASNGKVSKISGWWFETWMLFFHRLGSSIHPNWRSHIFQRGRYINHQPVMEHEFYFSIYWAHVTSIFQRGWNHQPTKIGYEFCCFSVARPLPEDLRPRGFLRSTAGAPAMERVTRSIYLRIHVWNIYLHWDYFKLL